MAEAVRLAIEEVGFENVDGRSVRDAFASIKDFDDGLIPPITMSDTKPYACVGDKMYQVRDGKMRLLSDKVYQYPILLGRE